MKTSPSIHVLSHLSQDPGMGGMVFISLAVHVIAVTAMFLLPNLSSTRTYYSPVYSVRLVNVQQSPPAAAPEAKKESAPEAVPSSPPPAEKAKPKEKP
ncbi:MAG TPA: hypothetical protein VLS90_00470, partial [Thermodesulfobacteriota bacterium]|nr:hypothetical protein [Thermodesulfobacteriota bacterium]